MPDVLIIGAGLAGLAYACELEKNGLSCQVLDASDGVGGRARTDLQDGFLLDRGFQVLLTAYPEAQGLLDYPALQLRAFAPGALVRFDGRFHSLADPWRRPAAALRSLTSPVGSLRDKIKIAQLRYRVTRLPLDKLFESPETSTIAFLQQYGFSARMIERFFRPFFSGIFLERELQTSSHMFEFVFRMFSQGDAALPAGGMVSISQQLQTRLPAGCVRLRQKVVKVAAGGITLDSGETLTARAVVVATDQRSAAQLLPEIRPLASRGTACLYFAAEKPPISEPILVLNGEGRGPVNNLCVPSMVAPSYAPKGAHLVSASVVGEAGKDPDRLLPAVRDQLAEWFGSDVQRWRFLRSYWIPDALPEQTPASGGAGHKQVRLRTGVYVCGDHCDTASINGALLSGRQAAEAVLRSFEEIHAHVPE
ncbi:MAG TPA: NAD(P)/FAD-dependent oxidoreductase [Terriglobales bacterium]|jgi:phytoene dehydrogenase-like protein